MKYCMYIVVQGPTIYSINGEPTVAYFEDIHTAISMYAMLKHVNPEKATYLLNLYNSLPQVETTLVCGHSGTESYK